MLADGEDDTGLKRWIVKRLEDISDADSDVLADYVLALLRHESPEEQVRQLCIDQLEDFLKDHTATFVDDVFRVIRTKSYLPGAPPVESLPTSPVDAPLGPANAGYDPKAPAFPGNGHLSIAGHRRKRSFNEQEGNGPGNDRNMFYGRNASGERAFKQPRRGGLRGGRFDGVGGRGGRPGPTGRMPGQGPDANLQGRSQPSAPAFPGIAPSAPPFPFDPSDPMAAILAMQAVGFPPLPVLPGGLPPLPPFSPTGFGQDAMAQALPGTDAQPVKKKGERCKDYDEKGFCALGNTCPYDHGADHIVVPGQGEEYDPNNSAIVTDVQRPNAHAQNGHTPSNHGVAGERGRGRGRGRGGPAGAGPGRRGRADFSHQGPNQDRSITTVVVENIPEDHFDEQLVRDFFSAFGTIEEVQMQAYKRLALVKYDSWASAKQAYESPKVIFDNRFVKVYWYKPNAGHNSVQSPNGTAKAGSPTSARSIHGEMEIDEIKKKQEELQRAHEEKLKKIRETEESRRQLEKRKEELLKSQAEEKKKLMGRLAAKTGKTESSPTPAPADDAMAQSQGASQSPTENGSAKETSSQTEALKAQLAALEAEARSLGIESNPLDDPGSFRGRGRGRGIYRGRGGYVPRGRGFEPYRGGYLGRGRVAHVWAARGGANKLDNRTKKVAVSGVEFDDGKDEALRQYLLSVGEFENIESNPERRDSQIITFKDRFTAEKFVSTASEIPSIGRVELAWVNNPTSSTTSTPTTGAANASNATSLATPTSYHGAAQESMTGVSKEQSASSNNHDARGTPVNEDYDVADDNDRWMAG